MSERCLIGLGANLGDRESTLLAAVEDLRELATDRLLSLSRIHRTAPIGGPPGQSEFRNAAVSFETSRTAEEIHRELQAIERKYGRERAVRWEARTIDLDFLAFGAHISFSPHLVLPHPRMISRRFVLEPACEVAGDWVHPLLGWTLQALLHHVNQSNDEFAVSSPNEQMALEFIQELKPFTVSSLSLVAFPPVASLHFKATLIPFESGQEAAVAAQLGGAGPAVLIPFEPRSESIAEAIAAISGLSIPLAD